MGLFIRMVIYFVAPLLAGYGFATFDENSMTLTINLEQLAVLLTGGATFLVTYVAGRIAKARGGKT